MAIRQFVKSRKVSRTGEGAFSPGDLLLTLWLELKVLARTAWNTALKQLNNSGSGSGMDGTVASGVGLGFVAANSDAVKVTIATPAYPFSVGMRVLTAASGQTNFGGVIQTGATTKNFSIRGDVDNNRWEIQRRDSANVVTNVTGAGVTASTWYDIIIVFNSATAFDLIQDGVKYAQTGLTSVTLSSIIDTLFLGGLHESSFSDSTIGWAYYYDEALTEAQGLELYNNPQQFLPTGASTPVVDLRINEAEGVDDPIIFDYSTNANHGQFSTSAGSPYDPWVKGITVGFQTGLSNFNRDYQLDGVDDDVDIALTLATSGVITSKFIYNDVEGQPFHCVVNGVRGIGITCNMLSSNSGVVSVKALKDIGPWTDELSKSGFVNGNVVTVVITFDFTAETFSVTFNGGASDGTVSARVNNAGATGLTIGSRGDGAVWYNGIVIETKIDSVGQWFANTEFVDQIGSNDGTINGSPVKQNIFGTAYNAATDIFGNAIVNIRPNDQGLNFVGLNHLGANCGTSPDTSEDMGAFVAFKHIADGLTWRIIDNRGAGTGFCIEKQSNEKIKVRFEDSTTDYATADIAFTSGEWVFVFVDKSGNDVEVFGADESNDFTTVDGTLTTVGNTPASTDLKIGIQSSSTIKQTGGTVLIPAVNESRLTLAEAKQLRTYALDNIINAA